MKKQIKWNKEDINFLKINYPIYGSKPIVERMKVSRGAVKAQASYNNVKCLVSKNFNKLKILHEETPNIYYWLGFIMADGHITKEGELILTLKIDDYNHLEKLASLLNIKIRKIKNNKYCSISCKDANYGISLIQKLNINGLKTYNPPNLNFLSSINKFLPFLAGFIDGDGCIGYKNNIPYLLRISCHKNWITNFSFFQENLEKYLNIKSKIGMTSRGYSYISISSSKSINKLKNSLMEYKIPLMERKWKI